jgi:hypothetical protein
LDAEVGLQLENRIVLNDDVAAKQASDMGMFQANKYPNRRHQRQCAAAACRAPLMRKAGRRASVNGLQGCGVGGIESGNLCGGEHVAFIGDAIWGSAGEICGLACV